MPTLPWEQPTVTTTSTDTEPTSVVGTPLHYALNYADLKWKVFPVHSVKDGSCSCKAGKHCTNKGKHPITAHGFKDGSMYKKRINRWWTDHPEANIGIWTGPESGIWVLDVDIDHDNGKLGDDSLEQLEDIHECLPATVEAITGGGGRHLFFKYPSNQVIKSGTNVIGENLDIRGVGGYVIVEPSSHQSGGNYVWEGSSDPLAGAKVVDAPEWLINLIITPKGPSTQTVSTSRGGLKALLEAELDEIVDALRHIESEDRDTWLKVGMAIHSIDDGGNGYELWNRWSKTSEKWDEQDQIRVWTSFKNSDNQLNKESIFFWAKEGGWINPLEGGEEEVPDKVKLSPTVGEFPEVLLDPPGIMNDITDWSDLTSPKPQPHLAIQSAMAAVSSVLGRRFKTNYGNWSGLFFINIAPSGEGKEYAKKVIEEVLSECGDYDRLGGNGYTSSAAVFSMLKQKPAHVTIIDEIGRDLQASGAKTNNHKFEAMTAMMEVFGRSDGVQRQRAYATGGLKPAEEKAKTEEKVFNPVLTMLGITTPQSFFGGLGSHSIHEGFLNRFLVMVSPLERQKMKFGQRSTKLPPSIKAWGERIKERCNDRGEMAEATENASMLEASPLEIVITAKVLSLFEAMDSRSMERRIVLDNEGGGLSDLLTRTVEKAMRLSLVCQLAIDPDSDAIGEAAANYAIAYAEYCDDRLVESSRGQIHDNDFSRHKALMLEYIDGKGEMTARELSRGARVFRNMKSRERNEILEVLVSDGDLIRESKKHISGRSYYVYRKG
jgi:hypothetical protein